MDKVLEEDKEKLVNLWNEEENEESWHDCKEVAF